MNHYHIVHWQDQVSSRKLITAI